MSKKNASINSVNSVSVQKSIDIIALNKAIMDAVVSEGRKSSDTLPYVVFDENLAVVSLNPDCKSKSSKQLCAGILESYRVAGMAICYPYGGITAYELIGDDITPPTVMLANFITLEADTREAVRKERQAKREKETRTVESARGKLACMQATARDKAIADYHTGKISREEMLAIVNR